MAKTIAEVNQNIRNGKAMVVTDEEIFASLPGLEEGTKF